MNLFGNMEVRENILHIAGVSTVDLVNNYGTPLYVFDEQFIRSNCRRYYKSFKVDECGNKVAYAGKAFLTIAMCQLIKEEGLCLDVVSGGELYTAYKSGFPLENIYFHGNNKTVDEIKMGIELGVGTFVVDNFYEIENINKIARNFNKVQNILLRVTPGIEAHTHSYIKTGQIDSKFGFTILNNEIIEVVNEVIELPNVNLNGFHCHIGSQIFEIEPYIEEVDVMLSLVNDVEKKCNYNIKELDLGGGFGIYYKKGDEPKKIEEFTDVILKRVDEKSRELEMDPPKLIIEPGRSIVGNAGVTLYTIGSIKEIPNIRKYVSVDGGMTDNIRPSLYNAEYECVIGNNVDNSRKEKVTIAGKCCESGDILLKDVFLPEIESGDILAMLSTGAYGYSMSNNYNKIPRAPVVFVKDGDARLICERQNYEDIIKGELQL